MRARPRARGYLEQHRPGRATGTHRAMSIAPLHGRPAPLLFVRQQPAEDLPHFRLSELKYAPLSSRARRLRRRRRWTLAMGTMLILLLLAVAAWTVLLWRG